MMVNLARRLDKLERLANELLNRNLGPVYLREGATIPESLEPERVITVKRVFINPAERPAEELPEITEPSSAIERPSSSFNRPLVYPPLGIV
jgi:hypothetical protein